MSKINCVTDQRIKYYKELPRPEDFISRFPLAPQGKEVVKNAREAISNIVQGKDSRKLLIMGPCSIHDVAQGKEIAEYLKALSDEVADQFLVIGRFYFEKPRTVDGWKGLLYDPLINNTWNIELGLELAREVLIYAINTCHVPTATEILNPFSPQYYSDLICWNAVGARTSETQIYREMMSGLSMPVGYKNGTKGDIDIAINSLKAVRNETCFIGINRQGNVSIVATTGNPTGHLILRGGDKPNYDAKTVAFIQKSLGENGLNQCVIIDCSHGNCGGDYKRQPQVFEDVIEQISRGNEGIIGLMTESNLQEGKQALPKDLTNFNKEQLEYGVSVTDACISLDTTKQMVLIAADKLRKRKL